MKFIKLCSHYIQLFSGGGPYHIKTSPLIYYTNQWTGFYTTGISIMKELNSRWSQKENFCDVISTSIKVWYNIIEVTLGMIQLFGYYLLRALCFQEVLNYLGHIEKKRWGRGGRCFYGNGRLNWSHDWMKTFRKSSLFITDKGYFRFIWTAVY